MKGILKLKFINFTENSLLLGKLLCPVPKGIKKLRVKIMDKHLSYGRCH